MLNLSSIFSILIVSLSFSLMGCRPNSESKSSRALFDTREEAAKAAKNFNCTGAHKMGDKWMPCKSHADHEEKGNHESHTGHHHHH